MEEHAFDEELAVVRQALAIRDLRHAAHHLAGALALQPLRREVLELLGVFQEVAGARALGFASLDKQAFHGTAALRAWLLRAEGRTSEAVPLLLRVQSAAPTVPYATWLDSWLEEQTAVEALDGDLVATAAQGFLGEVDFTAPGQAAGALASVLAVLRRVQASHPESEQLFFVTCVALRRAGAADEALALAEHRRRTRPDYFTFVALAGVHRERGQLAEAIEDFRGALTCLPDDVGARLDIGDLALELGRLPESLQAYEEALAREEDHEWAVPSAWYVRFLLHRHPGDREALRAWAQAHPESERAQELAHQLEPYVSSLHPPASSLEALAERELRARPDDAGPVRSTCGSLEAPSAVWLCKRLVQERRGQALEVRFAEIPEPDPRLPLAPVEVQLWRYQGEEASPAVPPGDPAVGQSLATIAEEPYTLTRWWDLAAQVAHQMGPASAPSVLACMIHPPPQPDGYGPWAWLFRVQTAAALVLAHLDDEPLFDLALGPVDWTSTAALIALSEVAVRDPRARPAVAALFSRLLDLPLSPVRYQCCLGPLLELAPRIPDLPDDLRARLAEFQQAADAADPE